MCVGKGRTQMRDCGSFGFGRRRALGIVGAAMASLALAACGSSGEENGSAAAAQVDGAIEKPNLKLGFIKMTVMPPLAIAK